MNKLTISYNDQNIITTSMPSAYTLSTEGKLLSDNIKVFLEKGTPSTLDTSINTSATGLITATTTETENSKIINTKTSTSQLTLYNLEVSPTPSLEDAGWAFISYASSQGIARNYWSVGDRKSIKLNGYIGPYPVGTNAGLPYSVLYCYILEFDHNAEVEGYGISFGTWQDSNGYDMCLWPEFAYNNSGFDGSKYFNMNHWGDSATTNNTNYGGWKGCDLRYDILGSTDTAPTGYGATPTVSRAGYDASTTTATNPVTNTLMSCLPADLRAVMKPITKYTDNVGGYTNDDGENIESNVTASIDYLPLLASKEVGFTDPATSWTNSYEFNKQTVYEYYTNAHVVNPKVIVINEGDSYSTSWCVNIDSSNDNSTGNRFLYYSFNPEGDSVTLHVGAYSGTLTLNGETTNISTSRKINLSGYTDWIIKVNYSTKTFVVTTCDGVDIGRKIKGVYPFSSNSDTFIYWLKYWLRSPSNYDSKTFRIVNNDTAAKGYYSCYELGLAPVFLV